EDVCGILAHTFCVVGRQLLRVFAALERIDLPGLRAVERLHLREALQLGLVATRLRTFAEGYIAELDHPAVDEQLPRESQRLDRVKFFDAASSLDVLHDQIFGGQSQRYPGCEQHEGGGEYSQP